MKLWKKSGKEALTLGGAAVIAGFCNSLLGAGGGILLSLTMGRVLLGGANANAASNGALDRRDILASSQAAMIPGCALSCLIYAWGGRLDTTSFSVFAIPAVAGGALGAWLLSRIDARWIARLFALLVIWSGIRMIFA